LIDVITRLSFRSDSVLEGAEMLPWPARLALPAIGLVLAWALPKLFAKEAEGYGVPEVMEAVALKGGRIRGRVTVVNAVASSITIGTGGSVGREDPTVQIGSSIGSTIGQLFRLDDQHTRVLVASGAAAGLAAAFNAPLAGVTFAVEIVLGSAAIRAFSPIVVSSVIATAISRWLLGDAPAFRIPQASLESGIELISYVVLGFAAGLVGVVSFVSCTSFKIGLPHCRGSPSPRWADCSSEPSAS
jgi:CIC family chloride channel protein